jgi:hypothetical protein
VHRRRLASILPQFTVTFATNYLEALMAAAEHRVEFRVPESVATALASAAEHDLLSVAAVARLALLRDLRGRGLLQAGEARDAG